MKSIMEHLVDFTVGVRFQDLPQEVVSESKRVLLDSVGCAVAGLTVDKGRLSVQLARRLGGQPESTIIGIGDKVSCANAAFANGELIHALDMEPVLNPPTHVTPYVLSAPLATAESTQASGKDLIVAIALAHEISYRIAGAISGSREYDKEIGEWVKNTTNGYSPCIFGGTAAVGRILKLSKDQMSSALGIAGYYCPVRAQRRWGDAVPSPMTKNTPAGWISQAEVTAGLLAQMGYTGDAGVFDGDYGFWRFIGSKKWEPEAITRELGNKWGLLETGYKPYPCTHLFHSALDCFYEIVNANNLQAEDIDQVKVFLDPLTDRPTYRNRNITGSMDAQMSASYVFAVAAHRIRIGSDWQDWHTITDRKILDFMDKVIVSNNPAYEELLREDDEHKVPRNDVSTVEIIAKGRKYQRSKTGCKGDASPEEARMTDKELADKFRSNTFRVLTNAQMDRTIETMYELEKMEDVSELFRHDTFQGGGKQ